MADNKHSKTRLVAEIDADLNAEFTEWAKRWGLTKTALLQVAMLDYLRRSKKKGRLL